MLFVKKNLTKREIPSSKTLDWREGFLRCAKNISFNQSFSDAPLLETGNSKIGFQSEFYDKVFVWNLPVVITCQGAVHLLYCVGFWFLLWISKYLINII